MTTLTTTDLDALRAQLAKALRVIAPQLEAKACTAQVNAAVDALANGDSKPATALMLVLKLALTRDERRDIETVLRHVSADERRDYCVAMHFDEALFKERRAAFSDKLPVMDKTVLHTLTAARNGDEKALAKVVRWVLAAMAFHQQDGGLTAQEKKVLVAAGRVQRVLWETARQREELRKIRLEEETPF
jgi:hypothetical protein